MKLSTKLFVLLAVLLAGIVIVGMFSLKRMAQINDKSSEISDNWLPSTVAVQSLNTMTSDFRIYEISHIYSEDPASLRENEQHLQSIRQQLDAGMKKYEKLISNPEERTIYDTFVRDWKKYLEINMRIMQLSNRLRTEEAAKILRGESRDLFNSASAALLKAVDYNVRKGTEASEQADQVYESSVWAVSATIIFIALLGLGIGLYIVRDTLNGLGKDPVALSVVATRVTNGDYNIDDGSPKRGVYGNIVSMVDALKDNIAKAHEESERALEQSRMAHEAMTKAEIASKETQSKTDSMLVAADKLESIAGIVSSASTQLAAQIEQSERGAAEQASRVSETATAMEEMNTTVLEVARNAGQASDVSASTRDKAEAGAEIVSKAVNSIRQVQEQSVQLKQDMTKLDQNAQSISQIMGVISDIADQTNLLALNAAIEAARAGEAGRGFAVVADEVRKLAEKTMASTTDVGNAIRAIQASASQSMSQVDASVQSIEEATEYANQSGAALREIVRMVDQTADQVRAIATASEQQSASSEEINQSITQVNGIATETARAMQEAAHAVSDLAGQAQLLSQLIDDMKKG